jgi:hypothetical protein
MISTVYLKRSLPTMNITEKLFMQGRVALQSKIETDYAHQTAHSTNASF